MSVLVAVLLWIASLFGVNVDPRPDGTIVEYTIIRDPGVQCFRHIWVGATGEPAMGEICSPADR